MTEPLPPEIELIALKAIETEVARRIKVAKAVIGQRYADGSRESFRSPVDDAKVGIVYKTDPDAQWVVSDPVALEEHLRSFPGNLEPTVTITAGDMPEALAILAEHAPALLSETTVLRPEVILAALAQSKETKQPAAPGIERRKAPGVLTVKPAEGAFETVGKMIEARLLTWDARPVLESGEEAS